MYDLNLTVPDLSSPKYSPDNKFLLLKNYLYELNEMLSFELTDKTSAVIKSVSQNIEDEKKKQKDNVIQLKQESLKKFEELKEQILLTAEEIEQAYSTAISRSETEILQTAKGKFTTKTEFGEYWNDVQTQLQETAEQITATATSAEEISTDLENYKKSTNSELTVQAQEIISHVESAYSAKTELGNLEERIKSEISQASENITEIFSEDISRIRTDISSVDSELTELISSLDVYIRRGELEEGVYGIEIGRSDSNIRARFTNDRLSFFQGFTEVAYVSESNLYITRAEFLDDFRIGNSTEGFFVFDTTERGLEVLWSDGN